MADEVDTGGAEDTNDQMGGGEMIDREPSASDVAPAESTAPAGEAGDAGGGAPEPQASAEDRLAALGSVLDGLEKPQGQDWQQAPQNGQTPKGEPPTVRQAANALDEQRLQDLIQEYGSNSKEVAEFKSIRERASAQDARIAQLETQIKQQAQTGQQFTQQAREHAKRNIFTGPLEKAAGDIFGTNETRAKNPAQARAYAAGLEASALIVEAVTQHLSPLVGQFVTNDDVADMVGRAMARRAGLGSGESRAAGKVRTEIAGTLARRQSNAGVPSRPSGGRVAVAAPKTNDEAKAQTAAEFRAKREKRTK